MPHNPEISATPNIQKIKPKVIVIKTKQANIIIKYAIF